jgi:hypothetical protein
MDSTDAQNLELLKAKLNLIVSGEKILTDAFKTKFVESLTKDLNSFDLNNTRIKVYFLQFVSYFYETVKEDGVIKFPQVQELILQKLKSCI